MADETNTGGGPYVAGDVGTGGGSFTGRDAASINVEPQINLNLRGDGTDTQAILFAMTQFSVRLAFAESQIRELQREQVPVVHPNFSEEVVRIIAIIFSIVASAAFLLVLYAAYKGLSGG